MFLNLSFRSKVLFSQLVLFILFFVILMPFVGNTVAEIVQNSFVNETEKIIDVIRPAENEEKMISLMQEQRLLLFMRATLFDSHGNPIFDTRVPIEQVKAIEKTHQSEVENALKTGEAYIERYSQAYGTQFAFIAVAFSSHGKTYVLRTAYPASQITEMMQSFETSFLILGAILLLFFMILTWLIFARLTRPIEQIIREIKPYQEGKTEDLPIIQLSGKLREEDEIKKLAKTLNSLGARVRLQVQKVKEEKNEKEAILESLGEGVMAIDNTLRIQYVNFIAGKMLGVPRRQLIGQSIDSIAEKLKKPLIIRCWELLISCQKEKTIVTDSISLGETRKLYLDLIAAPKADEQGAIIVLQDNSDHYRVLDMGKDFVANASHELRTPITVIRGFAETLQDLPEISSEMLQDITEKILRNCQRMDHLVRSLLTLADIENLPLSNLKECNLVQLIEDCRDHLLSVHHQAKVEIEMDTKEPIIASVAKDLLELAIFNLLENAVKYSEPGASIWISLNRQQDAVLISIKDQGIGIPETDLPQIFNRFYTIDKARSRKFGGAGLGLSIVKTIIEKHDGTIQASSEMGKGTTFTIYLPLHHP
jgi:two-component system, OmpR family, phosphate regulon sensor histidine kinase PhoR